jgi:D-glycero-alpha-D-manno-heptose-7-phosphate kinase
LRIGLAGGGTDVSPYCDQFGGAILNATISLSAMASITPLPDPIILLRASDRREEQQFTTGHLLPVDGTLDLLKGVYNRIKRDFGLPEHGFLLNTTVEAPAGSGLGTSSTLVVAIIGAFTEMLKLPLGQYDIAQYAFDIERNDLQWVGGRQDQYAATFGGVNYMEFFAGNKVIVNPLHLSPDVLSAIEQNLVLYFTATSRDSATIIREQARNVTEQHTTSIAAMHQLKKQANGMKNALLKGETDAIGEWLDFGFAQKRQMAANISNSYIEQIYQAARAAGATGGKISGAGGGGFMIFYCPGHTREAVSKTLNTFGGEIRPFRLTREGLTHWTEE